jgi:alpha-glucosidase (family GH31 glycosyl hydrolase)
MSMEATFIVGDAIKVSPVLEKQDGKESFESFFPAGKWLHMHDYSVIDVTEKKGKNVSLPFPDDKVHAHLRPGYLVPVQKQVFIGMESTKDLVEKYFSVIINRDEHGYAKGNVYIDDNSDMIDSKNEHYQLILQRNSM